MAKKIKTILKLNIEAGKANPAPPIGPALGQHGLNIMEFCQAYNAKTKTMKGVIPAQITVYEDRSFDFILKKHVLGTLQKDITRSVEYKIGSQLEKIVKPGEKVFLSGSSTFWLNSLDFCLNVSQVRGGNDRASVYPRWRELAWIIRESEKQEEVLKAIKDLGITYLVVHGQESQEFYHDFKYPDKFEEIEELEKVYDKDGDRIYRIFSQSSGGE